MAKRSKQSNGTFKSDDPATMQNEAFETTRIFVLVNNVWCDDVKWLKHDVFEAEHGIAELMVANKQAKVTKDDITAIKNAEAQREVL